MKLTIKEFFDLVESDGGTYKIKTPSGFKLVGNLFKKQNKNCKKITLSNGKELSGSDEHLVEVTETSSNENVLFQNNSYWINLGNINEGELVWCENEELSEVIKIEDIGIHNTYDLEVLDGERKYISNGVISHNCGKTAIVEGLAIKIHEGDCPRNLVDKRIVELDLTSVVAGTKYRGQFEERLKVIMEELRSNPNIIVFIDEIHTLVGSGNSSGSMDGSNIFKPALARGELQCIGATTLNEFRKNIEKDGALERRFQKVIVEPSSVSETIEILKNVRDKYETYHKVNYSDEVIEACVKLADRYITDRGFPDKAFDILDEVGARMQTELKVPEEIEILKKQAAELKQIKVDVVKRQQYEKAAELRDKEKKLITKLDAEKKKFEEQMQKEKQKISIEDVYSVVSTMTNIPVSKMNVDDNKALINLDKSLIDKVIGQNNAVIKIAKSIKRNRLGIKDPNRPIGSFVFLGSTGVGKTYLAKQLAKEIFGSEDSLIRVDMSEYQEKHSISKMLGTTAGYVGYDDGGFLTEKVKNKPYSVILFDEVEKAHKDIFTILLQILDDGYVTDGQGRKINFKNTLIILTSNIGVKKLQDFGTGIGFSTNTYSNEEAKKQMLMKEMKSFFSPEFINRIDDTIVFNTLSPDDIKKITRIELDKLMTRLLDMKYVIKYDDTLVDYLTKVGYDEAFGARPLKRAIQDKVEDFLSEEVLLGKVFEDKTYMLSVSEEQVNINEELVVEEKPKKVVRKKKGVE
jgi:ATP-dependent Clp protease ATP-binding subunit ClpC